MAKYVLGDTHGCRMTLQALVAKIESQDPDYKLVMLGDYVDRGLFSKQVVDYLIELQECGRLEASLIGNHDIVWAYICGVDLAGQSEYKLDPMDKIIAWWFQNGLGSCLDSYGVDYSDFYTRPYGLVHRIREAVPQKHKDFLKSLQLFWENEKYFACHAFLPRQEMNNNEELINSMLWDRPDGLYLEGRPHPTKKLILGHTGVKYYDPLAIRPIKFNNCILMDTHATQNGISAINLETEEIIFQTTDARDIINKY